MMLRCLVLLILCMSGQFALAQGDADIAVNADWLARIKKSERAFLGRFASYPMNKVKRRMRWKVTLRRPKNPRMLSKEHWALFSEMDKSPLTLPAQPRRNSAYLSGINTKSYSMTTESTL